MIGRRPGIYRDDDERQAERARDPRLRLERARRVEAHAARVRRELALYDFDPETGQMYLFSPPPAAK